MGKQTNRAKRTAEEIERRYDPECDIIPGAPMVTATEKRLLEMVLYLVAAIESLEKQVETIQEKMSR